MDPIALGPSWLDPGNLAETFGLVGLLVIIFAECGLLIGFFLPGDSLLFTAGLLVRRDEVLHQPIWLVCLLVTLAAIAGNQVGYEIGRRAGPALFRRPDSRLFKQEYVDKTYAFFDKHGPRAIVLARFIPIVRTFITVVAGISGMSYRTYTTYSIVGAVLWGTGVTLLGYAVGDIDIIAENIEPLLLGIVALSLIPVAIELLRTKSRKRDERYDEPGERARVEEELRAED